MKLPRLASWLKDLFLRMGRGGAVAAMIGIAISLAIYRYLDLELRAEAERVRFLKNEVAKLDKEVAEVAKLKDEIAALLARKQIVDALHVDHSVPVRVFERLARGRPAGTYLTMVRMEGSRLHVSGFATSHSEVAAFVNNLDSPPVFNQPQLIEVRGESALKLPAYPVRFSVSASIKARDTK